MINIPHYVKYPIQNQFYYPIKYPIIIPLNTQLISHYLIFFFQNKKKGGRWRSRGPSWLIFVEEIWGGDPLENQWFSASSSMIFLAVNIQCKYLIAYMDD